MIRRPKQSSARNPFAAFREIGLIVTISEDLLEGTRWSSPPLKSFGVDWSGFLDGTEPPLSHIGTVIGRTMANSELPLGSVLVELTAHVFGFLRQIAAAPTTDEIAAQLAAMRKAAMRLAALTQGGDGHGAIKEGPLWTVSQSDGPRGRDVEEFIISQNRRSTWLHPILQDHINLVDESSYHRLNRRRLARRGPTADREAPARPATIL